MPATTVKSARKRLGSLVGDVNAGTVAVPISGKRGQAVLISLERYTALQEANFLLRSPELMDSLRREMARTLAQPPAPPPAATSLPSVPRKKRKNKKRKRKK